MRKLTTVLLIAVLALSCVFAQAAAEANDFPSKTVEAMVGWNAGGGGDIVFRKLADVFPKYANGQTMVIKNVGGASGITGAVEFLDAAADGYNVMHWNNATVGAINLTPNTGLTGADTFRTVCQVVASYNYLVVRADSQWNNLNDVIDAMKKNPGKVTIGNAGNKGGNHLAALRFEKAVDVEVKHVAYSGGGPAINGLLAGEVDCVMANAPEGIANVQNGQLKILAMFSEKRYTIESMKDVPTGIEQGVDLVLPQWRTVVCPKDTPDAIVEKLASIYEQCCKDPEFVDAMTNLSVEVVFKGPAAADKFTHDEDVKFAEIAKDFK